MKQMKRVDFYQVFLHVSLISLVAVVFVLARQNAELKQNPVDQGTGTLKIGDWVDLSETRSVMNQQFDLRMNRRLLLILSTKCPFCEKSVPSWKELAAIASSKGLPVIAVSLDSLQRTRDFAVAHRLDFPVGVAADPVKFRTINHISVVPTTLIQSADGHVEALWFGLLTAEKSDEIKAAVTANSTKSN